MKLVPPYLRFVTVIVHGVTFQGSVMSVSQWVLRVSIHIRRVLRICANGFGSWHSVVEIVVSVMFVGLRCVIKLKASGNAHTYSLMGRCRFSPSLSGIP